MSTNFWSYFLPGTLGILLQICLKYKKLRDQGKAANHPVTFKNYLSDDWVVIAASFITVGIGITCIDEIIKFRPQIIDYVKWLFVFIGYTGSSILQGAFSVTSRKMMQIIDVKSNVADGVVPPVNKDNIEGAQEIIKEEEKK